MVTQSTQTEPTIAFDPHDDVGVEMVEAIQNVLARRYLAEARRVRPRPSDQ